MPVEIKVTLLAVAASMAFLVAITMLAIAAADALARIGRKQKGGADEAHNDPVRGGGSGSDDGNSASSEGESGSKPG